MWSTGLGFLADVVNKTLADVVNRLSLLMYDVVKKALLVHQLQSKLGTVILHTTLTHTLIPTLHTTLTHTLIPTHDSDTHSDPYTRL